MDILKDVFSFIADIVGIIGFALTAKTYSRMKKLKSSDDRVSFRLKKEEVLQAFNDNLGIIKGYNINANIKYADLQPIIQAMENVLVSVKSLDKFDIWAATAKSSFKNMNEKGIQIRKMKAGAHTNPEDSYTDYTPEEISKVFNDFSEQLEKIIQIVEGQT